MKKKKFIGVLVGVILLGSITIFLSTGYSNNQDQDMQIGIDNKGVIRMKVTDPYAVGALPPDLMTDVHEEIEQAMLSADTNETHQTKLTLDLELEPEGKLYSVTGKGEVFINGSKSKVELKKSLVSKAKLKNGNTYIFGPMDGNLIYESGKTKPVTIALGSIIETGQRYFTLTLGNFGGKIRFFIFGKENFIDQEIINIQIEYHGG